MAGGGERSRGVLSTPRTLLVRFRNREALFGGINIFKRRIAKTQLNLQLRGRVDN